VERFRIGGGIIAVHAMSLEFFKNSIVRLWSAKAALRKNGAQLPGRRRAERQET